MSLTPLEVLETSTAMTIEHVLSLLLQAIPFVSDTSLMAHYAAYLNDIDLQEEIGWPKLLLSHAIEESLFKIHRLRSEFVETSNALSLIHQILYVEQLKDKCYASKEYARPFSKVIITNPTIDQYSINDMVSYVKTALAQYSKVYGADSYESQMVTKVLRYL